MRKSNISGIPSSRSREYQTWLNMRTRCKPDGKSKKDENYRRHGIKVCDSWNSSFANFYMDMGDKPEGLTLDRIDSTKDYSPDNCRWATPSTQAINCLKRRGCSCQSKHVTKRKGNMYNKFRARTPLINGRRYSLGCYRSEEDATDAVAYAGDFIEKGFYA